MKWRSRVRSKRGPSRPFQYRLLPQGAILALLLGISFGGCYSFRGGSAPAHLETMVIPEVVDNSGSGRAALRFDLSNELIQSFREDNSLRVVDNAEADARLDVTIVLLRTDERRAVSSNDRETLRGVSIEVQATFYDNVKDRAIYDRKLFAGESTYDVSEGAAGEEEAIAEAIEQLVSQIVLGTVAEW